MHKIVKNFKKLGVGTPPLKKREREKKMFSFVAGFGLYTQTFCGGTTHDYRRWHRHSRKTVRLNTILLACDNFYVTMFVPILGNFCLCSRHCNLLPIFIQFMMVTLLLEKVTPKRIYYQLWLGYIIICVTRNVLLSSICA